MLNVIIAYFFKKKNTSALSCICKNVDVWLGSRVHNLVVLEGYGEF